MDFQVLPQIICTKKKNYLYSLIPCQGVVARDLHACFLLALLGITMVMTSCFLERCCSYRTAGHLSSHHHERMGTHPSKIQGEGYPQSFLRWSQMNTWHSVSVFRSWIFPVPSTEDAQAFVRPRYWRLSLPILLGINTCSTG